MNRLKNSLLFLSVFALSLLFLSLPQKARAHATPILYNPAASSIVDETPENIIITFSERIEAGASGISVFGPDGTRVDMGEATVNSEDRRIYSINIDDAGIGTYTASWQVVSSDDGHFTKGAFVFSVGEETAGTISQTQFQIEHSSAIPEAMLTFLELLGQAIISGVLVFMVLLKSVKGLSKYEKFAAERVKIAVYIAITLIIIGTSSYILLKTLELETLRQVSFSEALNSFIGTTTGQFTLYRLLLAGIFLSVFFTLRNKIYQKMSITKGELLLFTIVLLMMAARAKVSHAAASSFFPEFSVFMNFAHLLFKDLWVGIVLSAAFILLPILKKIQDSNITTDAFLKLSKFLIVVFGMTGLTGAYIIWLHLKSFENILTTEWGIIFIILSITATVLFTLRVLHYLMILKPFTKIMRFVAITLPLEGMVGIFLLFSTAFIIITTPPLDKDTIFRQILDSRNSQIILSEHPYDDDYFLITFEEDVSIQNIVLTLTNSNAGIGPIVALTEKRFEGGYSFPKNNLSPSGAWKIDIVGQRLSDYDLHANTTLNYPQDLSQDDYRKSDFLIFTVVIAINAIGIILLSVIAYKAIDFFGIKTSTSNLKIPTRPDNTNSFFAAFSLFLIFSGAIFLSYAHILKSDFQKICEKNFHVWNQSVPMENGAATSSVAVSGCSLGRSAGQFHFGDAREYVYFARPVVNSVAELEVTEPIEVGIPTTLTFAIKDFEGNPERDLIIDHDRLLHVIIIGADFTTFTHIHPEDLGPITDEAQQNGIYSVEYTFPNPGRYLVAVDFSVRATPSYSIFRVNVEGEEGIREAPQVSFERAKTFGDYHVELDAPQEIKAREIIPFSYSISKNGLPVENLSPYLGSPMHLAILDTELRDFVHGHGELPKSFIDRLFVSREQIEARAHVHKIIPDNFGPNLEAYLIFPRAGIYKVFGEIMHEGKTILTEFTIEVEE